MNLSYDATLIGKFIDLLLAKVPAPYKWHALVTIGALVCWWTVVPIFRPEGSRAPLLVAGSTSILALSMTSVFLTHAIFLSSTQTNAKIAAAIAFLLLTAGTIAAFAAFILRVPVFARNVTGVLVLRVEGDSNNATQRDIVRQLNSRLSNQPTKNPIEVHARGLLVTEDDGLSVAHRRARAAGQEVNAKLVVWGTKTDDRKFYPRITIVFPRTTSLAQAERTYEVQELNEIQLPSVVVDAPFYLVHFAEGFAAYERRDYATALAAFETALASEGALAGEAGDLAFFAGQSALGLVQEGTNLVINSRKAVEKFSQSMTAYSSNRFKLALAESNLAVAYFIENSIAATGHLDDGIRLSKHALETITEDASPNEWAKIQTNLGILYGDLASGDRAANLRNAIAAFHAALRVRTRIADPFKWSRLQTNLGIAYRQSYQGSVNETNANLRKAIEHHNQALLVTTRETYPAAWAENQTYLGVAYTNLSPPDKEKAITSFESALSVLTADKNPREWAVAQLNYGIMYKLFADGGNTEENLKKSIGIFTVLLNGMRRNEAPYVWAKAQSGLGDSLFRYFSLNKNEDTRREAMRCFRSALEVFSKEQNPIDWSIAMDGLGRTYFAAEPRTDSELRLAIQCFSDVLSVPRNAHDRDWATLHVKVATAYNLLSDANVDDMKQVEAHLLEALEVFTKDDDPELYAQILKVFDGARQRLKILSHK